MFPCYDLPVGGDDVVHISAVKVAGLNALAEGQKIQYAAETRNGKTSAIRLILE